MKTLLRCIALAACLAVGIAPVAHAFNYFPAQGDAYNWTVYRSDGNYSGIDTANGWVAQWNNWYLRYFTPTVATNYAYALQNKTPTGISVTPLQREWRPVGNGGYFVIFFQALGHATLLCTHASDGSQFYSGSGCGWGGSGYETQFSADDSAYMIALPN